MGIGTCRSSCCIVDRLGQASEFQNLCCAKRRWRRRRRVIRLLCAGEDGNGRCLRNSELTTKWMEYAVRLGLSRQVGPVVTVELRGSRKRDPHPKPLVPLRPTHGVVLLFAATEAADPRPPDHTHHQCPTLRRQCPTSGILPLPLATPQNFGK